MPDSASPSRAPPPLPRPVSQPNQAYRAPISRVHAVRLLAVLLGGMAMFSAVPALPEYEIAAAPGWARLVLGVAGLKLAYALWMAMTPDVSAVRIAGWAYGAVAVLYAAGGGALLFTPRWQETVLGWADARGRAGAWCVAVALVDALGCYLALRFAHRWRRDSAKSRLVGGRSST